MSVCVVAEYPWKAVTTLIGSEPPGMIMCADTLVVAGQQWAQEEQTFYGSPAQTDLVKVPRVFVERLTEAVCYAA